MNFSGTIVPIEVKAGSTGRLKSLQQFLSTKSAKVGIRVSEAPLQYEKGILSVPFYLVGQIDRLLKLVPHLM
jgi:hypothetical protein